jgi:penicillin-insensitive murein endopeptidase
MPERRLPLHRILVAGLLILTLAGAGPVTPAPGPVKIIGEGGMGCIQGAVRLPDAAPGLQTIRIAKSSFWGHPDTIAHLRELGLRARAAGLPDLYMGDLSGPRGGPLAGGHMSHQMGLDADVYLDLAPHPALTPAQREALEPPSLVRPDGRAIEPARWRPEHATLLKLAATLPGVDRVLVNAAIKKQLCETVTGDRSWVRLIRPWWGHASHMHINFVCPAGQPDCPARPAPPPSGDGCDASLQWWFDQLDHPAKPDVTAKPAKPRVLPAACKAIMSAPS